MVDEQKTEEDRLREALAETTNLLYALWRCRTDRERAELSIAISEAFRKYGIER